MIRNGNIKSDLAIMLFEQLYFNVSVSLNKGLMFVPMQIVPVIERPYHKNCSTSYERSMVVVDEKG